MNVTNANRDDEGNILSVPCAGCGENLLNPRNSNLTIQHLKAVTRFVGGLGGWTFLCITRPEAAVVTAALNHIKGEPIAEKMNDAIEENISNIDLIYDGNGNVYCPKCGSFHLGSEFDDVYQSDTA